MDTLAIASPNFWFLAEHDELLLKCAAQAERLVFSDANAALFKIRLFSELLAQQIAARSGIAIYEEDTAVKVLRKLDDEGVLSPKINQIFHILRKAGNIAVHGLEGEEQNALDALRFSRILATWFHKVFGKDKEFEPGPFLPPPKPTQADAALAAELERLKQKLAETEEAQQAALKKAEVAYLHLAEKESLLQEGKQQQDEAKRSFALRVEELRIQATKKSKTEIDSTKQALNQVGEASVDLDEADTRKIIDAQLRDAGWEADSTHLTYKAGVRPQKGKNLAIAEWPTKSGPADYILFVGLTPVATVEAKRRNKDVSSALKQAQRYSKGYTVRGEETLPEGSAWDGHALPFLFSANGRPFLKQLRTKSGIWFRDARVTTNISRPLVGWPTPEGLMELLGQDIPAADATLETNSSDYLDLRYYQHDAIRAVEAAIAEGKRNILTAMATGTGKTRTCIGLVYRFCKAKRFRRVLFLVDRTSLGEQTADAFKDFRLESHQTFNEIYDVKEIGDVKPDKDTRLQIATIQGMVKRLLFPADGDTPLPVDQYDCIIVDECHRGYNLDKDMSDTELTFRSESDYISKYSRVLDHFDAVRIGLTATPALHTTDLFGKPVYTYSYRQAVIDGYLVDHEPPIRIVTELAEDGITWKAGQDIDIFDAHSGEVDTWNLEDEVSVEIDEFNKRVITEPFNKVVCGQLAKHLDPTLDGKTLIFCATDSHADMVVDLLKQAFVSEYGEVEDDAVIKITGNSDKPLQLIRCFKNERLPNVVVTVDLLTTGIDVPEICNLVFLRRVRSRILYEQMLGRATRLCDDIGKEWFRIFDAVDLYSALQDYTEMKPVVQTVSVTFQQLISELEGTTDDNVRQTIVNQFRAKFQRKKRLIKDDTLEKFQTLTGHAPQAFADQLGGKDISSTTAMLLGPQGLGAFLDGIRSDMGGKQLISHHEDKLRREERGYGTANKPEDYLESFRQFILNNQNEIAALKVVLQRPGELTRQQLKELKQLLDEHQYSEVKLRTAWRESKNQDIAASIIGFIRQLALGSPLMSYEERVDRAMKRILSSRQWTAPQRQWLNRIGEQMRKEIIVDREALNSGQFQANGGFPRLNKVFDGRMEEVLGEINEAMWRDAG
ncbi:type I restriction-modification system endonuclease [Desulfovibrio subterraneus]|uniref:Type I restriction-modification system deoxyribonuclease n=1 Tax=Desulfovibrio subterraneus TaxID=2718620 RepID=A0A7J0BIY1_9BACT|nr:type I restriction-modification system endonuclease [Desulfovibrio subterraneus]GFM33723.1 type I restriction-modification system deoxyribonuclease [Desulfovibrio subterraneus]